MSSSSQAVPQVITSRDNPLIKQLRKQVQEPAAYRKTERFWIEGEHLCEAYLVKGFRPDIAIYSELNWPLVGVKYAQYAINNIAIPNGLMAELSTLESPASMGWLCSMPAGVAIDGDLPTVILDRLQDPGNVGSILRSAAAFGYRQVLAIKGTVALYAPKVLRAGMGAHFGLRLIEGCGDHDLDALNRMLATTSSHQGTYIHELLGQKSLPRALNWVLGHEGQGVSPELMARARLQVRIAQPGGEESLNVAMAAAICLHASATAWL